ncbi:MAG: radical SAM protein [Deltaproteobacteria bacterium]|nr:radical SAM protein [Deltaproteobacteria bacterium]
MGRGPTNEYFEQINDSYVEGTLTCLKPETVKKRINTDFPLILNIEPTNSCNARCYYCAREEMVKSQGINYLPLNDFKKIINQVGDKKLIMLNLHKDGEPLLHKNLPEMVAYVKQKDAAEMIHLNTNGILINSSVGKDIINAGIDDITISVDAATEETYYRFKRVRGLDKLEREIKKALDYRTKIGSKTIIRVKIMEFNEISKGEIELFRKKWTGVADEVQVTGVHSWSGAVDVEVTDEQTAARFPCVLLWYMLAINSNGKVGLCSVDWDYSGVVGNIHTQSIREIWNDEPLKRIRRAHLDGIWNCPPVCKECVVWVSVGNMWKYLKDRKEFIE